MPQTTTIRVRLASKERVDRLRGHWHRLRGERLTQQEMVEKALAYVEDHMEAFATEQGWRPWTKSQFGRFVAFIEDIDKTGLPTDLSEDIDRYVYGPGADEADRT